jgi:hypothetical protein
MYDFDSPQAPSAKDFVERELRSEPDITYPEMRERAAKVGLNVPPFLYGATRRTLGLPARPEATVREPAPVAPQPARTPARAGEDAADERLDEARPDAHAGATNGPAAAATNGAQENGAGPQDRKPPAKGSGRTVFEFAVEMLKLTPEISFQDLRDRALLAGLKLPPIVYGRAKALLGLVPTKPRRKREAPPAPRSLRQVDSAAQLQPRPELEGLKQIEQLVATAREVEAQCRRLRAAVEAALLITEAVLDDSAAAGDTTA